MVDDKLVGGGLIQLQISGETMVGSFEAVFGECIMMRTGGLGGK